jgi:oligopeptide/dipeptide ABC transporter ATP-binding protein
MAENEVLLSIEDLYLYFKTEIGDVQAVDGVDLKLHKNEAIVVLGESGCGKSSLMKAVMRLLPRNVSRYEGKVVLDGLDVMKLSDEEYRQQVRWMQMSMVPQAAMTSLNPVLKVGDQVAEPMIIHEGLRKEEALKRAAEMFKNVGVPVDFLKRYAFELSGGMRQRVAIAMSLVTHPKLVFLDEPTSALDVLTQANIFNLLKHIKAESNVSFILITHDIATSSELADRVAVMYAGHIVELSDADLFFEKPLHPYSQKLMASVPRLHGEDELEFIVGKPPSLIGLGEGCRFMDRCEHAHERCKQNPPMVEVDNHLVKCWLYADK